jgi:hypothetical protein
MFGRAMVQAVSRRPLTVEDRVRSWVSPYGICGGQSGTETGFSPNTSVFPCQFHSTVLHYLKKKLIIFRSSSSQGCTISLKAAVRPSICCGDLLYNKKSCLVAGILLNAFIYFQALLSLITSLQAESHLDDLNLAEDFPLDDKHRPSNSHHPLDTDFIEDDINESAGEDYRLPQSPVKKESIIYKAMLEALKRPEMSQQLSQVLPILRSMSPPQRLTLAALLTAQVMSSPTSESPTLDQVIAMFGVGPQDGEEQRQNMTSSLLLPLSLDIANIFRGAASKTPEVSSILWLKFIPYILRQVHSVFQRGFSTKSALMRPLSCSSILYFR